MKITEIAKEIIKEQNNWNGQIEIIKDGENYIIRSSGIIYYKGNSGKKASIALKKRTAEFVNILIKGQ